MNYEWEQLGAGVWRTRLPFLDVTVGLVSGSTHALLVDAGTTLAEAHGIEADVALLTGHRVGHVILTHNHFDHVLGCSWFKEAEICCAPEVAAAMTSGRAHLREDAVRYGADPDDVDRAIAAMPESVREVSGGEVDLGGRTVSILRPGPGHTNHDLIVTMPDRRTVVFCGDLVEQSGDPVIDADSDLESWPVTLEAVLAAGREDGVYVPGHGAVVDAHFIRLQQRWLGARRPS